MTKFISKIFWIIWNLNYSFAKRLHLGKTQEELSIASIFLSTLILSIYFASILFFLRVETKYSFDIKILSSFFFLFASALQLAYLFNNKKRYQDVKEINHSFSSLFLFFLIWLLTLIILGISMLFQYFDGSIEKFLNYI